MWHCGQLDGRWVGVGAGIAVGVSFFTSFKFQCVWCRAVQHTELEHYLFLAYDETTDSLSRDPPVLKFVRTRLNCTLYLRG